MSSTSISNLVFVDQHVWNAILDWESRFGLRTDQRAFDDLDAKHRLADSLGQLGRNVDVHVCVRGRVLVGKFDSELWGEWES